MMEREREREACLKNIFSKKEITFEIKTLIIKYMF